MVEKPGSSSEETKFVLKKGQVIAPDGQVTPGLIRKLTEHNIKESTLADGEVSVGVVVSKSF